MQAEFSISEQIIKGGVAASGTKTRMVYAVNGIIALLLWGLIYAWSIFGTPSGIGV